MGEEAVPSAGSGGWKTPACTVAVCIAILWTGLRRQQQQQQQLQQSGVQRATNALGPGSGALLRAALLPEGAEVAAQPAGRHGGLVDAGPSAGANPAAMPQAVADAMPSQGVVRRARGPALLSIRLSTAEEAAQHLAMAAAASRKAGRPRLPSAPADSANASTMREWCESSAPAGKILSCERKPPCALNEAQHSLLNEQDCTARKRYSEWPMYDPYLSHLREADGASSIAKLVERLGSRTMLIAGDSVSNLDFRGLRCAVQREELFDAQATRTMLPQWRKWGKEHSMSCCGQMLQTVLGGRVVFVGVYKYEPKVVSYLLKAADVLLLNYGLHYRNDLMSHYEESLSQLFRQVQLQSEKGGSGVQRRGTRVLFRETTAQHFKGTGSYTKGAERIGGGCLCFAHSKAASQENHVHLENSLLARLAANLTHGDVPIVPFYALTQPRFDMHNAGDSCGNGASRARAGVVRGLGLPPVPSAGGRGACCDCTHLCFTPQLYDAYFDGVERALSQADRRVALRKTRGRPAQPRRAQ